MGKGRTDKVIYPDVKFSGKNFQQFFNDLKNENAALTKKVAELEMLLKAKKRGKFIGNLFETHVDIVKKKNTEIATLRAENKELKEKSNYAVAFDIGSLNKLVDEVKSLKAEKEKLKNILTKTACHTWNKKMTKTELDNLSEIYRRCDGRHEWKLGYTKGKTEALEAVMERVEKLPFTDKCFDKICQRKVLKILREATEMR
jgi:hypothetical protein